jgi:hypothetical protein
LRAERAATVIAPIGRGMHCRDAIPTSKREIPS